MSAASILRARVGSGGFAGFASCLVACSALTSLDGLSGGSGGADGGLATNTTDTGASSADGGSALEDAGSAQAADDASTEESSTPPEAAPDAAREAESGTPPVDSGGGTDACIPTALVCDGKAHACNGVIDEGCPSAITIGAPGTDQLLGGEPSDETPFVTPCPTGQVLVGIAGATGQWIDAVYGICGVVGLHTTTSPVPYTYSVTISAGATLATEGTVGESDTIWKAACPSNQAVVGIAGNSGIAMDQLVLSCAPLTITGSPGSFTLQRGTVTALAPEGDTGGGSPFTPVVCTDPQVITLVFGSAGGSVDALGVACATPAIDLVP